MFTADLTLLNRRRAVKNIRAVARRQGYTLIELMVVVAIVAVLAVKAAPKIADFILKSKTSQCEVNRVIMERAEERYQFEHDGQSSVSLGALYQARYLDRVPVCTAGGYYVWISTSSPVSMGCSIHKWTGAAQPDPQPTPAEYFTFIIAGGKISGYNGGGTDLVIPGEIGGTIVTTIGQSAFFYGYLTNTWEKLTSVILPDSIITIGGNAFHSNTLTSIDIPDSVTSVGANAFNGNKLTSVNFGTGLTIIGAAAFTNNNLTEVTLPSNISQINDGAFSGNAITKIIIGSNVAIWENAQGKSTALGTKGTEFSIFYTGGGKAAGTYIYVNGKWSLSV